MLMFQPAVAFQLGSGILEMFPRTVLVFIAGRVEPARSSVILAGFGQCLVLQGILVALVVGAVTGALNTLCSKAYGGKRYHEMWMCIQASTLILLVVTPVMGTVLLFGERLLLAMGQDAEIAAIAGVLLRFQLVELPLTTASSMLRTTLQSQNITRPQLLATIVSWVICLPLAYLLGLTLSLGYIGIPVALAFNPLIKFLLMLPVLRTTHEFRTTWPGWRPKEAARWVPRVMRLSLPMALMLVFQNLGFSVMSLMTGWLPSPAVMMAADSIYMSTAGLALLAPNAVMSVGIVRIGNALGAGHARRAALASRVVVVVCVGMLALLPTARLYMAASTPDEDAIREAMLVFRSLLVLIPLTGFSISLLSVFMAAGKQKLGAQLSCLLQFGVATPVSYWLGIRLDCGLVGIWIGNLVGTLAFGIVGGAWWMHVRWDALARERERRIGTWSRH
ncbi:hypothetical protein PINS_up006358 [Pythium insidiosum]|nr:hypothetical protein PINS_up006358 [Pythium insidiosum]